MRPRKIFLAAGYAGYLAIGVLSLLPGQARPHTGADGEYEHWLAYALVGGALAAGYFSPRAWLFIGLALTLSAAALELVQNLIPGRTPELAGFLASTIGAWCGIAVVGLTACFQRNVIK